MEDLVPILASGLTSLRRSPGNNVGWVDDILRKFQRDRPAEYHHTRRVHGLALRLADLARLTERETATLSLGLLFSGLAPTSAAGRSEDCHAWMEYLWNEPWVEPCLKVAAAVRQPGSEEAISSMVTLIATAARSLDAAAVLHTSSTLGVLKSLRAQARTTDMERLVQLLWSEEGQAICDVHARQGGQPYVLDAADIKHHIEVLRAAHVRAVPARAAVLPPRKAQAQPPATPIPPATASPNFEKRKRGLAVTGSLREVFATSGGGPAAPQAAEPAPAALARATSALPVAEPDPGDGRQPPGPVMPDGSGDDSLPGLESAEEHTIRRDTVREHEPEAGAPTGEPALAREDNAMTTSGESPTHAHGSSEPALLAKLEELRTRLLEIERLAAEAEELLATIRPSVEDFTVMLTQFESMLSRWKSPADARRRAA